MPLKIKRRRVTAKRKTVPVKRRRRLLAMPTSSARPIRMVPSGVRLTPETAQEMLDQAKRTGMTLESDMVSKIKRAAMDAAGAAVDASDLPPIAKMGVKAAGKAAAKKIEDGMKARGADKIHLEEDPVMASQSMTVQSRRVNNAIVPDKSYVTKLSQGVMTKREEKFYKKWPLQDLLIYQSAFPDRQIHTVSPGTKAFYAPFYNSSLNGLSPVVQDINLYRKAVEMSTPVAGVPSSAPPFLPASIEYGTVVGGQDFLDSLNIWGWADQASCISAMTNDTLPVVATSARQSGNSMKFGIQSMTLEFHIENINKYFPAEFTIQYWKRKQANVRNLGLQATQPVALVTNDTSGVPLAQRAWSFTSTTLIPNSGGATEDYTSELSVAHNATTFGGNKIFQMSYYNLATRKIRLTAGGRVKVKLTVERPPTEFMNYANMTVTAGTTTSQDCMEQVFCTITAKGTQEIALDVYRNGDYQYKSNSMTNPVYYTVTNIKKTAKIYAPSLNIQSIGTVGYEQVNLTYADYAAELVAFGEQRTPQFAPEGEIFPITSVADAGNIPPGGQAIVIPVMTNQSESSAGSR